MKKYFLTLFIIILSPALSYSASSNIVKQIQEAYELYSVGNYEDAAVLFESSFMTTTKNGKNDLLGMFKLATYTGLSYKGLEDYKAASLWFETALSITNQMKDKAIASSVLAYLAECERLSGNYDKAISSYLRAISGGFISNKDKSVLYFGLAESYRLKGNYEKSKEACDLAAKLSTSLSAEQLALSCDIIQGEAFRTSGDYAAALQVFGKVLDLARAREYNDLVIEALGGLGLTSEALGKNDVARANFEESLSLSIKNEIYDNIEATVDKLIAFIPPTGNYIKQAEETAALFENHDITDTFAKNALWRLISAYYKASGNNESALLAAENAYTELLAAEQKHPPVALYDMALIMYTMSRYYSAIVKLDEAITEGGKTDYPDMGKLHALKGECLLALEKYNEALSAMQNAAKYDDSFNSRLSEIQEIISNIKKTGIPQNNHQDNKTIRTDETPIG